MLANPYQKYQQNQVETVSPQQLVLMLYDGALRFLKLARSGIYQQNIEQSHNNIIKTQNILSELMSTLDMNQGEIAQNLFSLYDYMYQRLLDANLKKDCTPLNEVEALLSELRDTWAEASKLL